MWNYSWKGVKLEVLETLYRVPRSETLPILREIAKTNELPDAAELQKMISAGRCDSCGVRINRQGKIGSA